MKFTTDFKAKNLNLNKATDDFKMELHRGVNPAQEECVTTCHSSKNWSMMNLCKKVYSIHYTIKRDPKFFRHKFENL